MTIRFRFNIVSNIDYATILESDGHGNDKPINSHPLLPLTSILIETERK